MVFSLQALFWALTLVTNVPVYRPHKSLQNTSHDIVSFTDLSGHSNVTFPAVESVIWSGCYSENSHHLLCNLQASCYMQNTPDRPLCHEPANLYYHLASLYNKLHPTWLTINNNIERFAVTPCNDYL